MTNDNPNSVYPTWGTTIPARAKQLGVSLSTMRVMCDDGRHPRPVKLGPSVARFHGPTLAAWDEALAASTLAAA